MRTPTVISTFAGCGGSSLGYKMAGYHELLAIDFDKNSVETFALNFPETPVWMRDIKTVTSAEIFEFTGLKRGELDVFDGSPPCQGFSMSGNREINDARNDLFQDYARLVDELQPRVFVMENVSGMVKGEMKGRFLEILKTLESLNYFVKVKLLNAMYYGVPQARQRLFFIGVRKDLVTAGIDWTDIFPVPSSKIVTVEQAFEGVNNEGQELVVPTGNPAIWMPKCQQGRNVGFYHPKGHGFNMCRLHLKKPSFTITKMVNRARFAGILHPTEDRYCTIAELKRIGSFPDSFQFIGTFEQQWARIGNAVMPLQMKAVALRIREKVLDKL